MKDFLCLLTVILKKLENYFQKQILKRVIKYFEIKINGRVIYKN